MTLKKNKDVEELDQFNNASRFDTFNQNENLDDNDRKIIANFQNGHTVGKFWIDPEFLNKGWEYSWRTESVHGQLAAQLKYEHQQAGWVFVSPDEIPALIETEIDSLGREVKLLKISRGEMTLFKRKAAIGRAERAYLDEKIQKRIMEVNSNGDPFTEAHMRSGALLQGQRFVGNSSTYAGPQSTQSGVARFGF